MKKLLTLLLLLALTTSLTACRNSESKNDDDTQEDATELTEETLIEVLSLSFLAPAEWELTPNTASIALDPSRETLRFLIPDEEYEVTLIMELGEKEEGFSEEDMEFTTDLGNGLSYSILGCGGALACYTLGADEYSVEVVFSIESTEKAPENLDGIWNPSTNLKTKALTNFIETAELTSK